MRLEELKPTHVLRAVEVYLDLAWPAGSPEKSRKCVTELEACSTVEEVLARFDQAADEQRPSAHRYTLRLGNDHYPFMKLVVQEYLVDEEYFFSVDTHDDLKITPDMPDYESWCTVRSRNRMLKETIESEWLRAGLPTHEDLRHLMEGIAEHERGEAKAHRLLVVDDERDVAQGLAVVLQARGYAVETAFDGRQVLERLEAGPRPDLLLLDYSMPELNGQEVMERLRSDERFRDLPILMATATGIDLEAISNASGLLRKPYPREVLFAMIEQMLRQGPAPDPGP